MSLIDAKNQQIQSVCLKITIFLIFGAVSDVDLTGGNLNGNDTVIYSKFGDIDISNSQASVNGLIYAPFRTVTIDCDNFNMNGLKDGEEINTYGTDPFKVDTDEDGLDDGDEIYFETNPLNPDTDGNGVLDGDEKRFQTFIHKVENEGCAVTEVRVSMEGTGNLRKTTTVESIMNKDILCSEVVGLVGEPFEIETTSQFDKATLTYVIDKSKLGDTEFDNLLFLWYDEENDNFVELDTVLDENNSTVTVETTHFSKYMLVDQDKWFDAWKRASLSTDGKYTPLATVICYDCSGSMSSNDRTFIYNIYNDDGTIAYSYPTCHRKLAIDSYIDAMNVSDITSLIPFDDTAYLISGFSSDKESLKELVKPYDYGGTNAYSAVSAALSQLNESTSGYSKHIILLSDGDVNVTASQINEARSNNIKIHTIGLGSGADNQRLQNCSRDTGGQHFKASTAEELDAIYKDLSTDNHFDLTGLPDEDEDGLPDEFEVSGLVVSNAQVFYTDPENPDCDGDGLLDGEEICIDYSKTKIVIKKDRRGGNAEYSTVIFGYYSDPWCEDTDGDKLLDNEDDDPCDYNELKNYFVVYDREGKDFIIQANWMIDWAYNNENVEIIELHTVSDFIDCWNNKIPSHVNSIHLYLHGTIEREYNTDYIDLGSPFLQFYGEAMSSCNNDFDILKDKYVETKVYLNACQGGTEDIDGHSVAKRFAEKIINGTPVEALRNDNVNYFSEFDFKISPYKKSDFDKEINIGGLCFERPQYISYNLFPRRQLQLGTWIEISVKKENGEYVYNEKKVGSNWVL